MLFCWVTTRHRLVGLGYGWMLRITYFVMAVGALAAAIAFGSPVLVAVCSGLTALGIGVALAQSIRLKSAGVAGQRADHDRRSARVAAMTGIDRAVTDDSLAGSSGVGTDPSTGASATAERPPAGPASGAPAGDAADAAFLREFDPRLDLVAPVLALVGLVAGAVDAGGPVWLSVARVVVGAAFLGAITDAMLLGHWYLVQPGLPRKLLHELVDWNIRIWPLEVLVFLPSPGMVQVFTGAIDDGWNGLLGWTWLVCAITTVGLLVVTKAALKERQYSAVMAATGLLYLAILTAFGMDLIPRAVLA
jgi:hypothetical protein